MKLVRSSGITTMRNVQEPWDRVTACKHYFPCDGLTNGSIVDVKGGVIAPPQDGHTFSYDATRSAVSSNALGNVAAATCTGSFEPLDLTKFILLMHGGYMNEAGNMRVAIGDSNTSNAGGGFGLSDGSASPLCAHASIGRTDSVQGQQAHSSHDSGTLESLGTTLYNALGTTGHFVRYALYRPDTENVESAAYRTDTGALVRSNALQTDDGAAMPSTLVIPAKFRMTKTSAQSGIARFDFDALPSDLLLAILTMGKEWSLGNRFIWPYWD